jgi:hypothetical protein
MSEQAHEFVFSTTQQARPDRLFKRIDQAVVRAWRAVWTWLIDGFAAAGIAECGVFIDADLTEVEQAPAGPATRYAYGAVDDDLQGDFDDIHALIRSLQTAAD